MQDTVHNQTVGNSVTSISHLDELHPDNFDWPEDNLAQKSLELVLSHFIQHTEIVQKKLEIAKIATAQGIEDIQKVCEAYDFDENMPVLKNVQNYESVWDDILVQFKEGGISADELIKVEGILKRIPETIKIHYEIMIAQNEQLKSMIDLLQRPEYKQALELTEQVQERPNPMSGFLPDDYALVKESAEPTVSEEVYMLLFD